MSKFQRSWQLFKRSMQVIGRNRKLLVFPVVITLFTCVIALFFIAPAVLSDTGHGYTTMEHWKSTADRWAVVDTENHQIYPRPVTYGLMAGMYLVSIFLATFFNVAFYNEILNALNGQPVSIAGGFRFASTRLKTILLWSLFTGGVGLIIKALEERVSFVGRWAVGLVGLAWSVASVFVVPMIVRDQANPVQLLKSSSGILKKTWGESLAGYLGIRFGGFLLFLFSIVLLAGGAYLGISLHNVWFLAASVAAWLLVTAVFMYILSVASQVYLGALFIYATEGVVPGPFAQEQMDMAWRVKSGRKARNT